MDEHQQPTRIPAWASHLVVFLGSSVVIAIVLEMLALMGARPFLMGMAEDTKHALQALTPWQLPVRVYHHVETVWLWNPGAWLVGAWKALGETFLHSSTAAVVEALQILAGILAAFLVGDLLGWQKRLRVGQHDFYFFIALIPVAVILTTVLAVPMLALVWVATETIGHVIPESPLIIYGGSLATGTVAIAARTAEGGLHHSLNRAIERLFPRAT